MYVIVHVAGDPNDDGQACARCGEVLIEARGAMTMTSSGPMRFYPAEAFVGRLGAGTVMMDRDASQDDEVPCFRGRD